MTRLLSAHLRMRPTLARHRTDPTPTGKIPSGQPHRPAEQTPPAAGHRAHGPAASIRIPELRSCTPHAPALARGAGALRETRQGIIWLRRANVTVDSPEHIRVVIADVGTSVVIAIRRRITTEAEPQIENS